MSVPFFRPDLGQDEFDEVAATLRSGWLTTGPRVRRFEEDFARAVGGDHALALNSGTAALHLAVEAHDLRPRQVVLVPTHTFAATAEVIRYQDAIPLLVDCDPVTLNISWEDATKKVAQLRAGELPALIPQDARIVGIIPVHVGGYMVDMEAAQAFASANGLWMIEDAAHAFPAAIRGRPHGQWRRCGENTSSITCFSFYANKTITTGEGGMAVTNDPALAKRMRTMALHGLSHDAWDRFSGKGNWDYKIVAPGFKYNMTDVAAAIGIHQCARADGMRSRRELIAHRYLDHLSDVASIELPPCTADRLHSWHLFPLKLRLDRLTIDRNAFLDVLKSRGVACSVHWRPLHLHPYYENTYGWRPEHLPKATAVWSRLISLPIFSAMTDDECDRVIDVVRAVAEEHERRS